MNQASIRNTQGIALYHDKRYQEAAQMFLDALTLLPANDRNHPFVFDIKLNLANSYQMYGDYEQAQKLYDELIFEDPVNRERYEIELNNLLIRKQDEVIRNQLQNNPSDSTSSVVVTGEIRLCQLINQILHKFPAIRLPIRALFVDQPHNTEANIKALGGSGFHVPISQGSRGINGHVLIYNYEFWKDASDAELRGNLAHELMHREWEDTGLERHFFVWDANTKNYSCLEWIIDFCVLGKGLEEDLFRSKKYILDHVEREAHLKVDISMPLSDLQTILLKASNFEMPGSANNIPKYPFPRSLSGNRPKQERNTELNS